MTLLSVNAVNLFVSQRDSTWGSNQAFVSDSGKFWINCVAKHFAVQTNLSNSLGLDGISRSFLSQTSKALLRHLQENADAHESAEGAKTRGATRIKKRSRAQQCYGLLTSWSGFKKTKNIQKPNTGNVQECHSAALMLARETSDQSQATPGKPRTEV